MPCIMARWSFSLAKLMTNTFYEYHELVLSITVLSTVFCLVTRLQRSSTSRCHT